MWRTVKYFLSVHIGKLSVWTDLPGNWSPFHNFVLNMNAMGHLIKLYVDIFEQKQMPEDFWLVLRCIGRPSFRYERRRASTTHRTFHRKW